MIVIDASALVEALLGLPAASFVEKWLLDPRHTLHVPHLADIEVTQVVCRFVRRGDVTAQSGRDALDDYAALQLYRHEQTFLLPRIWELRNNLTAYDAVYVALAEALHVPLVTRDRRIAGAPGLRTRIEVI